ncbi:MAG: hypothetical protein QNJ12_15705 [Ilumatobacter sp.]|uniref:hypothetical protein n=1 Tax=Ilumatobacter sp. TaxID=1967498 RepID=UPI00261B6B33|nr:hypothetical protein [Ilumatobacter sp.]MDJ0770246.1 hypothetical protein [Ilumatobacter sp.]
MRSRWIALIAAPALVLTGCGGDDTTAGTTPDDVTDVSVTEAPSTVAEATTTVAITTVPATTVPETTEPATTPPASATTESVTTTTSLPDGPDGPDGLLALLEAGDVTLAATSPDGGVSGEILDVSLVNETDEELAFVVPCGFVFVPEYEEPEDPDDGDEGGSSPIEISGDQRMMVVQASDVVLGPGGTAVATPYVMCVDSDRPAPEGGAVYGAGSMTTDELLELAECICGRDLGAELDPMTGAMSLQLAVWAVADGELPAVDDLSEIEGALGDVVGGGLGLGPEELAELEELTGIPGFDMDAMLEQAMRFLEDYQTGAATWLEECGVELTGA